MKQTENRRLDKIEKRLKAIEDFLSYPIFETIKQKDKIPQMYDGIPAKDDPALPKALEIIRKYDRASASLLQRRLTIGYARAMRLLDELEVQGYVSHPEGSLPREVIKK